MDNKRFFSMMMVRVCLLGVLLFLLCSGQLYASKIGQHGSGEWERKASLAALERYSAFCRKNKNMLEKNFKMFPPKKLKVSGEIKNLNGKDSFAVFSRSINDKIFKYLIPAPGETHVDQFTITCAQNEWESIQIGIWALKDVKNFSYEVTDLVHENNRDRIKGDGSQVRTYYVYNVAARKEVSLEVSKDMDIDPAGNTNKKAVYYEEEPVALLDLPGIDIPSNTAQGLWLDLRIDKACVPGQYHGRIFFKSDGKKILTKPLYVTVYPFELDKAEDWGRGAYISKFIDEKEAINLLENGHNQVSWWTTGGYKIFKKEGGIASDFTPFVKYLEMLDQVGMTGPHVVFLGGDSPKLYNKIFRLLGRKGISNGRNIKYRSQYNEKDLSPPFESYLIQTLKQFQDQMRACGHGDMPVVLLDEPDHRPRPERMDWYNTTYQMVEKGIPELLTMGVFYHKGDEIRLSHHHSVWSTNRPSLELFNTCKKAGKRLYTYHGGYKFYDRPGKFRFDVGIIPWVYEASGTFYWAIWNHSGKKRQRDDIFSPAAFSGQSTTISRSPLKTEYGPLSTLIHRGFREAVDDARYIRTLENKIKECLGTRKGKKATKHGIWLKNMQTQLRKRLYVRGGHVANHKEFAGYKLPASWLKFENLKGEKHSLEDLEKFSEFIRKDVTARILDLVKE